MTTPYMFATRNRHWVRGIFLLIAPTIGSAQDTSNTGAEIQAPSANRIIKTERQKWAALRDAKRLSQKAEEYEKQGKANEAERMAEEALALEQQVRGPWHIDVALRLDQ